MTQGKPDAQAKYGFGRVWQNKGNLTAAIAAYRDALAVDPAFSAAAVALGRLFQSQSRMEEALEVYLAGLEHRPADSALHKYLVNVLTIRFGLESAFRHYGLERIDRRHWDPLASAVLCCTVLRNEGARLPYFLQYYREKGVGAFLAVDNGSTDGGIDFLLDQPDVFLWRSEMPFHRANFGAGFFEPILRRYGQGYWCVIADADELLYYPECERRSLPDLCASLDGAGKLALKALHVDMYSDLPIGATHYTPGRPFQDCCPWFDRRLWHRKELNGGPWNNQEVYWGGVRQRVFGNGGFYLSKVPLLRYSAPCILAGGQHWTNIPASHIASETGCLLHFKYFSSFPDYAASEARRGQHADSAAQYRLYAEKLSRDEKLCLYDPVHSVRLENSDQLVRMGAMQRALAEDRSAAEVAEQPRAPEIHPAAPGITRPFWSVMLTVHRRIEYIAGAIRSVLAQAPAPEDMEIEVVIEGPEEPEQDTVEALVRAAGGGRVFVHRCPERAGHPGIFNLCIGRARGHWIHILHDDDLVRPGFYAALAAGIAAAPGAGAAFCRYNFIDESGAETELSPFERESPGILEGWLDRIAVSCRLQTPAVVVRRDVYERLGGYDPRARSAFDWEMWTRLAVHYPVWFEPKVLASFRRSASSESSRLTVSGRPIADARAAIELARSYLPRDKRDRLSREAGSNYARTALEIAQRQIRAGQSAAALANIAEGLRCSRNEDVVESLLALLQSPVW